MFAALAQLERDTIVRRTTDGRNARARKDGEKGGNLPLGYQRVEGQVVINPACAAIVRRIFALKCAGSNISMIAAELNSEGVPTGKGGAAWYPSSVREILLREAIYRGGKRGDSGTRWPVILDPSLVLPKKKGSRRSG